MAKANITQEFCNGLLNQNRTQLEKFTDIKLSGFQVRIKTALNKMGVKHQGRFRAVKPDWSIAVQKNQGLAIVACGNRKAKRWHWVLFDGKTGLVYDS